MKVLVTGANGQLGYDVVRLALQTGHEVFAATRRELDITHLDETRRVFSMQRPEAVIHCAAYTAVDAAESDADTAFRVNAYGTRNVALASEEVGARLVYVSTDYVFDGCANQPYSEHHPTAPQSVYGKSKRAGEELAQMVCRRLMIARTAWVYGEHGNNFVRTMLQLGRTREVVRVVDDQIGSPTYTRHLAAALLALSEQDVYGIYHLTGGGHCSWYEFAAEIFRLARLPARLEPCSTIEFPRPAPRPAYSVLDNLAFRVNGMPPLPAWQNGLRAYLQEIGEYKERDVDV
ncbi:dTDP-4-dehydrorhamnose reductase [Alicyclobacillus sp. TC]|uniref:dTDP-4-dehydrorhamnose reductase n=1 Tax=Alicyclobacillus sp. TC TaxID=2606450 RepID=UPI00193336EB|nr:dTDP-4-dehydrorhamnose reductase [Alicyclobacillus sp. TC]QRF24368.1 dTDP-4-dehydrorhamnose reductase [Alicyclobacillus sp. TC]